MQAAVHAWPDAKAFDPGGRDPRFIRTVAQPLFERLRAYFRSEMEGGENVPREGPFIAVANHNGGPLLPDCWVLVSHWWSVLGVERESYGLVHDAALAVPMLRDFLTKVGGLRASRESADWALSRGAPVLVFPGGELDSLKSFWRRHRIDFRGRTGFIRLALEHHVPIVPVVNVGGHEVYFTLWSSERLARWSGLAHLTRVKTLPVNVGLPWGFWLTGFVPYLPLPAKFTYRVGPPIVLDGGAKAAEDENRVHIAYARITRLMQSMLDDLARRRRVPILG